jgi:hypothetical protein
MHCNHEFAVVPFERADPYARSQFARSQFEPYYPMYRILYFNYAQHSFVGVVYFVGSSLPGSYLPGSYLPGSYLPGSYLPRSDLPGASLPGLFLPN